MVGMWAELTCQSTVLCRRGWLLGLCWTGGWCIPGRGLKRRPNHRSLHKPFRLAKSIKNLQVPCGYKALLQAHEERRLEISKIIVAVRYGRKEGNWQPPPPLRYLLRARAHSPNFITTTTGHLLCARHKPKNFSHINTCNYHNKPSKADTSLL